MRRRRSSTIRKTIITIIALVVVFAVAGTVYVLVTDRSTPQPEQATTPVAPKEDNSLPTPRLPGANAPEGVAIDSILSPTKAGTNTSLSATTNAGSSCIIIVSNQKLKMKDSGLAPQTANDYGIVSWTWSVPSSTKTGNWLIKVTCTYNKRVGVAQSNLEVTK